MEAQRPLADDTAPQVLSVDTAGAPEEKNVSQQKDVPAVRVSADAHSSLPDDYDSLPRVADSIPVSAWLVALLSMAERFSFYGLSAPFQNFMQNRRDDPLRPGALGWGQSTASQVSNVFYVLTQVTPVFGAIAADKRLGRYKLLVVTFCIYLLGATILLISSLPPIIDRGATPGIFITSLVLIAVGMSGANGALAAFIGDQYTSEGGTVKVTKKGKRVVIDKGLTIESIYNVYYWCINIGSLSGIATTSLEKYVDFWAAYLLPLCALSVSAMLLIFGRKHYSISTPERSALPDALKATWYGVKGGFDMNKAKPSYQLAQHGRKVTWTESFVDELKRGLSACRMLIAWPVLWLCRVQLSTNLIAQAAQMEASGVPNDMMYNANPIVIIIFLPLFDKIIFPRLRRSGISLSAVTRVSIGFILEAAAMGFAAIVQKIIYNSGPCFDNPLHCPASRGGTVPNSISIFVQLPIYVLEAFSEIFATPAGYELAFTLSPRSMKSVLQAMFSATNAFGAALSIAISPKYKNPSLLWVYASLAIFMGLVGIVFYGVFGLKEKLAKIGKKAADVEETSTKREKDETENS